MKIEYDPKADALYLRLSKGRVAETKCVGKNTFVDLDKNGNTLGIEILFFGKKFNLNDLAKLTVSLPSSIRKAA
jgi:uncharacterized protein YuzE